MSPRNDTTTGTLTSLSLHTPTIPFDLVPEILCWLPVKLLLQLKCVCKSWKSLISDPKFAKKHLCVSKTYHHHHHLIVQGRDSLHWDATISSIFSDAATASRVPQLQLICPEAITNGRVSGGDVSSCDGILLFSIDRVTTLLWNPSIRKFWTLPPLNAREILFPMYTFGYDHFIDNYKVFAVSSCCGDIAVSVFTLSIDSWRRIDDFPYSGSVRGLGMFASGTVNWLVFNSLFSFSHVIVSLDLENESYRTLLMPNLDTNPLLPHDLKLGVLMDCLCIFANGYESWTKLFSVWVMKEYGIQESWTKLFSVPYVGGHSSYIYAKVVYVFEDDQVLLEIKESSTDLRLVVYNSTNGNLKIPRVRNISPSMVPKVYVESLISPCS